MKIRDLVSLHQEGNFATAIDLSAFRSPEENSSLCSSFCFAQLSQEPVFGSWDWLRMISRGLAQGNRNVWSMTANYGHGKTHFGVVLANYLGQPWDSTELKTIYHRLESVSSKDYADQIFGLRERKQRPYFTLCLQGHQMPTLRQAVFQEVERELRRHEASRGYMPPLWQAMAVRWLDQLDPDKVQAARYWADQRGRDLGDIRRALEDRDPRTDFRLLVDELATHVMNGFPPDLGLQTTMRQLLDQIYSDLCGTDGPFSGIAILFDEFHVYVDGMARHPQSGDSLQDLLEAVLVPERVSKGSAIFIALGTMDPNEAAKRSIGTLTPDNPIAKQLNRIPEAGSRYILRSELETVLDGLLQQNPEAWQSFESQHAIAIRDATIVTYEAFRRRFEELQWDAPTVKEKVTKGSFPLHPITTQLISNLDFQVVQNPRGVLDFVKDQFNRYADHDADQDGRPNWIVANELYEPFSPMFKQELKQRVDAALDSLGGDADEVHEWVLAAMTLVSAGGLPTPQAAAGGYARLVAEIADMDLSEAQQTLDDLVTRGVIDFERVKGSYRFFTGSSRAQFGTALRTVRGSIRLDTHSIASLTSQVNRANPQFVAARATNVEWGHNADWAFSRFIVTRAQIEAGLLKSSVKWNEPLSPNGTRGWTRAAEFVFLPQTADDADWIRKEGSDLIRQAFPDLEEPPVVIAFTSTPATEVLEGLTDLLGAEAISNDDRARLKDQYAAGVDQILKRLKEAIDRYSREPVFRVVAPSLKSTLDAVLNQSVEVLSAAILGRVYKRGPRKFLSTTGLAAPSHVNACAKLAGALLVNKVDAIKVSEPNGPAMTVAERFLRDSWGVIGNEYLLRSPTDQRILDVWVELNEQFPAGSIRNLGSSLRRFVNPPYGFDTCTLALAVCGWLGNQGREVEFFLDGNTVSTTKIQGDLKMPTLLGNLLRLRVKREDVGELNQRAQALVTQIESKTRTFTRSEADEAIKVLDGFCKEAPEDWEVRAPKALTKLRSDRESSKQYAELAEAASTLTQPNRILERLEAVKTLEQGLINEGWPSPETIRDALLANLTKLWETAGDQQAQIKELELYSQRKLTLEGLVGSAQKVGATGFANLVRETIKKLDVRKKELTSAADQKGFAGELKGFQARHATLIELRQTKESLANQASDLSPLAPDIRAKYELKVAEIEAEIATLVDSDDVVRQRLSGASSFRVVESVSRSLEVISERLQGTRELRSIENVRKHVNEIIQLFNSLSEAEMRPPEKRASLLKDVAHAESIATSEGWPETLRHRATKVATYLKGTDTNRSRNADKEFERNEKQIDARSTTTDELEELKRFFTKPQEYVSDACRERAPRLVQDIENRLSARGVERIKSIAHTLRDRAILLELAAYLQEIAERT